MVNEGTLLLTPLDSDVHSPKVYYYDGEDTFIVGDTPASLEMFEEVLAAVDADKVTIESILWESYDFDRPNDRAIWELKLAICP